MVSSHLKKGVRLSVAGCRGLLDQGVQFSAARRGLGRRSDAGLGLEARFLVDYGMPLSLVPVLPALDNVDAVLVVGMLHVVVMVFPHLPIEPVQANASVNGDENEINIDLKTTHL